MKTTGLPVDYYDGMRAWDAGYPEVALTLWLLAAEMGDPRSLRRVGDEYASGAYLPQSDDLAVYYRFLASTVYAPELETDFEFDVMTEMTKRQRDEVLPIAAKWVRKSLAPGAQAAGDYSFDSLSHAAQTGNIERVRASYGPDRAQFDRENDGNWNVLHSAALGNQAEVVALILADGNPSEDNTTLDGGYSPLHVEAMAGAADVVELLVESRSYSLGETHAGMSASAIARMAGHEDLAIRLDEIERDETRRIQAALNQNGYNVGRPDGMFGPITYGTVQDYTQRTFHLSDGRIHQGVLHYLVSGGAQ